MNEAIHIGTYIDCLPNEVYQFASNPENLPRWAAGLASSEVKREGDVWKADAPFGKVKIKFSEENSFGILDHSVELDTGVVVHNPVRVVPSGNGSEFIFSLIRQPGMSENEFKADKRAVEKDLKTLKELLERMY